ncbi:MAG: hypothetical protein WBB46_09075, partial [Candidatus Deferrimicrobiaceae bacterium]
SVRSISCREKNVVKPGTKHLVDNGNLINGKGKKQQGKKQQQPGFSAGIINVAKSKYSEKNREAKPFNGGIPGRNIFFPVKVQLECRQSVGFPDQIINQVRKTKHKIYGEQDPDNKRNPFPIQHSFTPF